MAFDDDGWSREGPALLEKQNVEMSVKVSGEPACESGADVVADDEECSRLRSGAEGK